MNRIEVLIGNNFENLFNESIKKLNLYLDDLTKENIIVVPDKLSLLTEQRIFELLNIEVFFNISVMGISKFANKIISENCLNLIECSNLQSKLLTLKAIQNVKEDFQCFSKTHINGLVDEMYAKIQQIKSSNININDLIDENSSRGTKLKFHDIRLIYKEYENLRENRLDSGALLSVFNSVCKQSNIIKNFNVFFIGFDSMTKQGIEIIKNVTRNSNNTFVSVCAPYNQPNENIYDQSFLQSIIKLCKDECFESEIVWLNKPINNITKNIILNNLFSRKQIFKTNNYINIYKATTLSQEINFIINSINYNLKTNKISFKDIAICAPIEIHQKLKTKLANLNISAHCDNPTYLVTTEPIKFILALLKYAVNPNEKSYLLEILNNDFFQINKNDKEKIINLLTQYSSVNSILNYNKNLDNNISAILKLLKPLKYETTDTFENYLELIKKITKNYQIYEKIEEITTNFKKLGEINLEKIYLQIETKLSKLLEDINVILNNNISTFSNFIEIFEKSLSECEINGIPSTINEIFIGDSKSFYGNIKYLYIISANDGTFPLTINDNGLITDNEINSQSIKAILEPTTKIINKRNKFKALETILSAKEKCYLCFHTIGEDQRPTQASEFITELKLLFNLEDINISTIEMYEDNKIDIKKICFNNPTFYHANITLNAPIPATNKDIIFSSLNKAKKIYSNINNKNLNINYGELFLKNKKTNISLIEKYNGCPKSAFLANCINLQPNKKEKIEANTIGSFIHEVAEIFVNNNKNLLGKLKKENIEQQIEFIYNSVIKKDIYYTLNLNENKFILENLKRECIRFCSFINYEQTISDFKPTYTEKYFGDNSSFKPIILKVDNEEYKICGFVDRIDICDKHFRIIDYKSGNPNFKNLKEGLFYGTKLQLFVYSEAINQNLNNDFFGAFYLPIKNTFNSNSKIDYSYVGFFINSVKLAQKCDKTLNLESNKSNILNCSLKKSKNQTDLVFKKNNNIISEEELVYLKKYAFQIIANTIKNMKKGLIDASPIKDNCNHCEFNKICKQANNEQLIRNLNFNISNCKFMELNYE